MLCVNNVYSGFRLEEVQKVNEINSTANIFIHEQSGAKLLFIDCDDENKSFSIAFRTPPQDSTGVAHILEHSVLCGSKKFPVKEPFVELAKGSLNTFLNAMTFSDKTLYPIASKNNKDFNNLMDVYLDAVLNPKIYEDSYIMMQEGWHYELKTPNDDLEYKGVVYNEMKGAFSSPDSVLYRKISQTLFPDTTYGFESGGDPEKITDLSQEDFLDFHKRYYHPSNSYIFLYGKLDILENLKFINENYLKNYQKQDIESSIPVQKAFNSMQEVIDKYPISNNDKDSEKTYLSLNYVVANAKESEKILAMDILEHLLLEAQGAPLKKALIDNNLGKDVYGYYDSSCLQPYMSIIVKNSDLDKKDLFKKVVYETLERLVKEGIDKKAIEASINRKEFELRENNFRNYPKGLIYNMDALDSWLYGYDPIQNLRFEESLENIKSALTTDYFEKIIKEIFLDNNHSSLLVLTPEKGLGEKKNNEIKAKLTEYKNSLSKDQIDAIIKNTAALEERQNSRDSKEALETIPMLTINDLNSKPETAPLEEKDIKGIKALHSNVNTNKIAYVSLNFNAGNIDEKLIPYLTILSRLLGKVDTNSKGYETLSQEIDIYTGGIEASSSAYFYIDNSDDFYPYFAVKGKAVNSNMQCLMSLMKQVIFDSKFEDKNRIKIIIDELESRVESTLISRGHNVAAGRALAYVSKNNKYLEELSGIYFYDFLVDLQRNYDDKFDTIKNNLVKLSKEIFNKDNLIVTLIGSGEEYSALENNINVIYDSLGENKFVKNNYSFDNLKS